VIAAAVGAVAASGAPAGEAGYIVVYKDGADASSKTDALEANLGFTATYRYGAALDGFAANLTASQLEQVKTDPAVEYVSSDGIAQAAGMVPIQAGESNPTGVRRIRASTRTSVHERSFANVAVIDTGSGPNKDLLRANGTNCVSPGAKAVDDNGHGTHIAGTIGAKNTGAGVVGVAPGTKIFSVKVLDASGAGSFAQVICGIDWVARNGPGTRKDIRVANMSLGAGGSNDDACGHGNGDALHTAICNATAKGVTFVVSAGGSSSNYSSFVPAAYPEVLTVTAMSDGDGKPGDDTFATFSNFASPSNAGQVAHTIAGPGVGILSDWLGNTLQNLTGTSMATAHVTGTVALCIDDGGAPGPCGGETPAQIVAELRQNAENHATLANGFNGDPHHPVAGRYYGFLDYAGSY